MLPTARIAEPTFAVITAPAPAPNEIVDKVAQFIERFVFIEHKAVYPLLALWAIQTHCYKDFEYTGYIFAHSPEPGSGKSRLLEVLDSLVCKSSGLLCSLTEATLFRTADGGTQLLDEVDTWPNRDFLRNVLNAGFARSGKVKRLEGNGKGKFKPVEFAVYAPRAMAGIGLSILHPSTRDRTFIIPMVKQKRDERREKFRPRRIEAEAVKLKAEITAWVKAESARVRQLYDNAETAFPYLSDLRDRTIDIVEPLASILEVAYADTPELEAKRDELLEAIGATRKDGEDFAAQHAILRDLVRLAGMLDPVVGNASELAAKLEVSPRPTEYEVAATLRRYGFETHSVRVGESIRKRYRLSRARLAEVSTRCGRPATIPAAMVDAVEAFEAMFGDIPTDPKPCFPAFGECEARV